LIYIKSPAPDREQHLKDLLDKIRSDDRVSYKPFSTADELRDLIENDSGDDPDRALRAGAHRNCRGARAVGSAPFSQLAYPAYAFDRARKRTHNASRSAVERRERIDHADRPGGTGKTRLAIEAAHAVLDHFADGAYFVALAPISEPALVAPTIAQTLGLRETLGSRSILIDVQSFLRDKRLLMMLDNFEQIVTAASVVSSLAQACAHLKIVVTAAPAACAWRA